MKNLTIRLTGNTFSGYGHRKLTIEINSETYSATTSYMQMTDDIQSDDEEISKAAQIQAMQFVCRANDIDETDLEFITR